MNHRLRLHLASLALPALVFALGLALSVAAAWSMQRMESERADAAFARTVQRVSDEVIRRFGQPVYGMNGARGLFAANPQVSREAFSAYVLSRNLAQEFPGVRGFGFVQQVAQDELAGFVAAQRADHAPGFALRQLQPHGHAQSLIVKYIQPLAANPGATVRYTLYVNNTSSATDNYRPPYAKTNKDHKRQCVFAGTVNEATYLKDATGGRRFWPVKCGECIDLVGLERDRNQLWGEAVARYRDGAPWWLEEQKLVQAAAEEQD